MCNQDTFGSDMNALGTREGQEENADLDDDDDDERGEDPPPCGDDDEARRIEARPARYAAAARIETERKGGYPSSFPPPFPPTPTPTPTDTVLTIPTPMLKPSPSMSQSSPAADQSLG